MSIDIPVELQSFVQQQLALGCFDSEQQIVAEGLRLLKAERDETLAGIQAGLADAAAGRTQPLHEAFAELRRELNADAGAMNYRVVLTEEAKRNLRAAYLWAAERAPHTAIRWLARFEAELETLSRHPERCARAPENSLVAAEIRQFIFGQRAGAYRVLFTIVDDEVRILHIRRAARDWAGAADLGVE